jgi:hypothetical protein
MDINTDDKTVDEELFKRLINDLNRIKDDPLSLVLTLHLYVEFIVNRLIWKHFKNPEKILGSNKVREFKFSTKVDMLNAIGVVEGNIFDNIKILNSIRNDFAHGSGLFWDDPKFKEKFAEKVAKITIIPEIHKQKMTPEDKLAIISVYIINRLQDLYNEPPKIYTSR